MLDKDVTKKKNEGTSVYLSRAAALVVARHPRALLVDQLKPDKFWARESLADAKKAYPASLKRNKAPSGGYREKTESDPIAVISRLEIPQRSSPCAAECAILRKHVAALSSCHMLFSLLFAARDSALAPWCP